MNIRGFLISLTSVTLVACGGGSDGGFAGGIGGGGGGGSSSSCEPTAQKTFVLEAMRDVYFWNDLLPEDVNVDDFDSPEALLASLTSVQPLDRFSFIADAQADSALFNEGEAVLFGFAFTFLAADDVRITRVEGGSPADSAGVSRGQQLLAVDGRTVAEIQAAEGLSASLGPSEVGVTRTLSLRNLDGSTFDAVLAKAVVTIDPVPQVRTYTRNGVTYGYIEFTTFVGTANAQLEQAFADFNAAGITDLIIDLRYNGGGRVDTAEFFGDLLGGAVAQGQVFSQTLFNEANIDSNRTRFFELLTQSANLSRVVFITTGGTASASELVINGMRPEVDVTLVGSTTFGKPVGQVGLLFCDETKVLRPTAFETVNGLNEGGFFDGIPVDCEAADDVTTEVGSEEDPSTAAALSFLDTGACPAASAQAKPAAPIAPFRPGVGRTSAERLTYLF